MHVSHVVVPLIDTIDSNRDDSYMSENAINNIVFHCIVTTLIYLIVRTECVYVHICEDACSIKTTYTHI